MVELIEQGVAGIDDLLIFAHSLLEDVLLKVGVVLDAGLVQQLLDEVEHIDFIQLHALNEFHSFFEHGLDDEHAEVKFLGRRLDGVVSCRHSLVGLDLVKIMLLQLQIVERTEQIDDVGVGLVDPQPFLLDDGSVDNRLCRVCGRDH